MFNGAAFGAGIGLMAADAVGVGATLYTQWDRLDALDVAGIMAPRVAGLAGGVIAAPAAANAYRAGQRLALRAQTALSRLAAPVRTVGVQAYEVGTADALRARSLPGDALDIHHVGQAGPLKQMIPGYSRSTSPAIAVPEELHRTIPVLRGAANLTPRQVLARDIWNLRNYTDVPNSSLRELIELNKQMYPGAFGK